MFSLVIAHIIYSNKTVLLNFTMVVAVTIIKS